MNQSLTLAYGSYRVPEPIRQLYELDRQLESEGLPMGLIGLRPVYDYFGYFITPPDLIPFADTGGDGIHFGFLTDFGRAERLETAPIVCVTPTNDPPIRLIARNIREFFDLACSVPYVEDLEQWWSCQDEMAMKQRTEEWIAETPSRIRKQREEVFRRLRSAFGAVERDVYTYMRQVLREREQQIALPTMDGLGVLGTKTGLRRYEFSFQPPDEQEWSRMREFLVNAQTEQKLAFIRDAFFRFILPDDTAAAELVRELMLSLGLRDEAARKFEL